MSQKYTYCSQRKVFQAVKDLCNIYIKDTFVSVDQKRLLLEAQVAILKLEILESDMEQSELSMGTAVSKSVS